MPVLKPNDLLFSLLRYREDDLYFEDRDLIIDCPEVNRLVVRVDTSPIGDVVIRTKPDGVEPQNPMTPLVEELAQSLYEAQTIIDGMNLVANRTEASPQDVQRMALAERYRSPKA